MRWLLLGLLTPPVVVALIWVIDRAAGTFWAIPIAILCVAFCWLTSYQEWPQRYMQSRRLER